MLRSLFILYSRGLDGAATAGAATVAVLGVIFGVGAVPIAWNTTYALYELFFVFLVLGMDPVLILVLAGRRFAAAVFDNGLSVIVVVLVLSLVLDGFVGVRVTVAICCGASIFVVIVVVPIAWSTTIALYELFCVFLVLGLGLVLILVPAGHQFAASIFDNGLLVIGVGLVLSVVLDGAVVAIAGTKVDFRTAAAAGATATS